MAAGRSATFDRGLDIATVILISLAAIGTAWCSYQGARWGAVQFFDYTKANELRTEGAQWAERTNTHRSVDVTLVLQYEYSLETNPQFSTFLINRFEPELRKAMDAWLSTDPLHNPNAPRSPLSMRAYQLKEDVQSERYVAMANALVEGGAAAQDRSDRYIFITVLFATVSFLGGIALKLRPPVDVIVTALGFVALIGALVVTLRLPIR